MPAPEDVIDATGADLSWSNDVLLAASQLTSVPQEPGVLVLVRSGASDVGREVVWAEAPDDLRFRARELSGHATVGPELGAILVQSDVRLRYAVVRDDALRFRVLGQLREHVAPS